MPIHKMDGRKNGKQKYRVRINYIDKLGVARQSDTVVYGLDEAKELERKLRADTHEAAQGKGMTVTELFEEYLKAKRSEVRETTLDKFARNVKCHILPVLGNYKLKKLTLPVLQKWKNEISEKNFL